MDNTPFNGLSWEEVRLDIDKEKSPDLIGSITDMNMVADNSIDAIYSSHNIEHLYPHEVPIALGEFRRVLKSNGFALITCPDIRQISQMINEDKLHEPAYFSVSGPITPFDILYGQVSALKKGNLHMAHHCGFTEKSLGESLISAKFIDIAITTRKSPPFDIWSISTCTKWERGKLIDLADTFFPKSN